MAKPPILGFAKTRLAKEIGDAKALEVYRGLLNYTFNVASQSGFDVIIFFTHECEFTKSFNLFSKEYQKGEVLGEKMENAFSNVFENYKQVLMIGADCPGLRAEHISRAFSILESDDVVFGPSEDGGYYLIGMKSLHLHLFRNKTWSTDLLLKESLQDLEAFGQSYQCMEVLNDIDTYEDLKKSSFYNKIEL